jgi:hypothetical protein
MNPQTVTSWIQVATMAVQTGVVAVTAIKNLIRGGNPEATDAELNNITRGVMRNLADLRTRIEDQREQLRQMPGWVEPVA